MKNWCSRNLGCDLVSHMTQLHMPNMCEALDSIPNATKKPITYASDIFKFKGNNIFNNLNYCGGGGVKPHPVVLKAYSGSVFRDYS